MSVKKHKWWALAAVCFGLFMALLDVTIVNVALPTIQRDLSASFSDLQWVINGYALVFAVTLVTCARLGDIYGRKKVFIAGIAVFSLGSLLCALSSHFTVGGLSGITMLNLARGVQGIGASAMMPLSLAIISANFQGKERGIAIGIWGGVSGLATAIGPMVGGILVDKVSWESIFYLNVPIGIFGILLSMWAIQESRDEHAARSVDLYGFATITISMFCLILALMQGNDADKGWSSAYILTLFAIAAVALVAFIIGELKLQNPMADPRLFKNASFTGAAIAGFCLTAGMYSLFFFLALYLQNYLGFSALKAGLCFLPLSVLSFLIAPLSGRLISKIGSKTLVVVALGLMSTAVFLMTRLTTNTSAASWLVLLIPFVVAGIGNGLVNPPLSSLAVGTVSYNRAGMASGISSVARQIGMAFGIAFLSAMLTHRYTTALHHNLLAMSAPGLPTSVRVNIADSLSKLGPIVGSTGLRPDPAHPNPYAHLPFYHQIQLGVQSAYIGGLTELLTIAGGLLAIGALAALLLIKKSDLLAHALEEKAS